MEQGEFVASIEFYIAAGVAIVCFLLSWYLLAIRRAFAMQGALFVSGLCLSYCDVPVFSETMHVRLTLLLFGLVWAFQLRIHMKWAAREQIRKEWACYLADFEIESINPHEFTWANLDYYDEKQREMEALGFVKVGDYELLHFARAFPELRFFGREFMSAEHDIGASVSQHKFSKPKTIFERLIDNRYVAFCSEFSDNTFLETNNAEGVQPLGNMEGYTFQQFPPSTPLADLLEAHKTAVANICEQDGVEVLIHATERDMLDAAVRQHLILRRDRQKKGGFTPEELAVIFPGFRDQHTKQYINEYRQQAKKIVEQGTPAVTEGQNGETQDT